MTEKDFENLDIEQGFVLRYGDAIRYLKWCASQLWERATANAPLATDLECAKEEWADLVAMAQVIKDSDWEWVLLSEHQMSASGIHIEKMVMANA